MYKYWAPGVQGQSRSFKLSFPDLVILFFRIKKTLIFGAQFLNEDKR